MTVPAFARLTALLIASLPVIFVAAHAQENKSMVEAFKNLPCTDLSEFQSNTDDRYKVDTWAFDQTPSFAAAPFNKKGTLPEDMRMMHSGDIAGQTGFSIDTFLAFQVGTFEPIIFGEDEPVTFRDRDLFSALVNFSDSSIAVTESFETGLTTIMRASAFDYGYIGCTSELGLAAEIDQINLPTALPSHWFVRSVFDTPENPVRGTIGRRSKGCDWPHPCQSQIKYTIR